MKNKIFKNWKKFLVENVGTDEKFRRLRAATETIKRQSGDQCFIGSCANTSFELWWAAKRAGLSGVNLIAGSATPPEHTGEPPTEHIWLTVDGTVYDPTWEMQEINPEEVVYDGEVVDFEKDPNALEYFGVDEVEDTEWWDDTTDYIMHHFMETQ